MPDAYETWAQAHEAAVAAIPPEDGRTVLSAAQNRQLLGRALEAAGVTVGRYGDTLADWLAGLEDAMCSEIARWVASAAQPPEGTVTEWGVRFTGTGLNGDPRTYFQPYPGEDSARSGAREARLSSPHITVTLMCRQTGPWTEAAEPEEGNDG